MKIQIFQIKVNEGRRGISPEAVHELANSISKIGLMNPITVDQDYTLIAGLHRLEAAKLLGWAEIECNISSLDGLLAELAEIDENLVRRGLDYIDEGKQLERRKEIYETLHPETRRGKRNGQTSKSEPGSVLGVASFSRDTSQKTGISPRTIEQKIQVAKNLTPETAEIVKEHGIGFKKALKLSRLAPEHQKEAVNFFGVFLQFQIGVDKYKYYCCSLAKSIKGSCVGCQISVETFDTRVQQMIGEHIDDVMSLLKRIAAGNLEDKLQRQIAQLQNEAQAVEAEIDRQRFLIRKLAPTMAEGLLTKKEANELRARFETEKDTLGNH